MYYLNEKEKKALRSLAVSLWRGRLAPDVSRFDARLDVLITIPRVLIASIFSPAARANLKEQLQGLNEKVFRYRYKELKNAAWLRYGAKEFQSALQTYNSRRSNGMVLKR